MADHTHPRADLTALLDGALPAARAAEVRVHLSTCASCREESARLSGALATLSALSPPPELPPFFATRLEARLREEPHPPPAPRPLRFLWGLPHPRLLLAAAGVAALAIAVAIPVHHYLETRSMLGDLELLQDYPTASAVGVDTPEDALVVAELDQLEPGEGRP